MLWGVSTIELGEKFFNEILACPVPLDMNVLKAMKRSPLGLDLYLWLTYRLFGLAEPFSYVHVEAQPGQIRAVETRPPIQPTGSQEKSSYRAS